MKSEYTGLIILAAGGSSRLGRPKQLLHFEGKTLFDHTINVAKNSDADKVIVVLGAYADQMRKAMAKHPVQAVVNKDWKDGIASSIRVGMHTLIKDHPQITSVVIMLCDQPYITASLINDLIIAGKDTGRLIAASNYGDATGVPACFHATVFPDLLQLEGDMGARAIMHKYIGDVATIPFPKGNIDIDTETDYDILVEDCRNEIYS